jgi:hypothetical protein
MKAFFWSVLGAVVSAALIYFVNNYLQQQDRDQHFKVQYSIDNGYLSLSKDDLQALLQGLGQYASNVSIAAVTVKNVGSEALKDQDAVVRVGGLTGTESGIIKVASLTVPGDDPDMVKFDNEKDRINIRYKLLNPGEAHRFWFAYNAYSIPSFTMRREGLSLSEPPSTDDESYDLGTWILGFIGLLFIFLIGAGVGAAATSSELKARGHDVDAMLKGPKVKSGDGSKP